MSKQLITANDIRAAHSAGKTGIEVRLPQCIITPEAKVVAEQLGITITEMLSIAPTTSASKVNAPTTTESLHQDDLNTIRQAVLAQLPQGQFDEALIDQLVQKVVQDKQRATSLAKTNTSDNDKRTPIKLVKGSNTPFALFDGAGSEKQIGIADVIGAADNSSMAAGFMQWQNAFFPWTLNYDEVNVVLDGELHIRHQGQTLISQPGDILFIPKGSSIEFGTPTHVRFVYVAWPANWQ